MPTSNARQTPAAQIVRRSLRIACSAIALSLAACASLPGGAPVNKKQILVIGNADYKNAKGWGTLANPGNDQAAVCNLFKNELKFESRCLDNLETRQDFEKEISDFVNRLGPDSTAVFYYSGHAVQVDGLNYLIPTTANETQENDLYLINDLYLKIRERDEYLKKNGTPMQGLKMIVLDACRTEAKLTKVAATSAGEASVQSRTIAVDTSVIETNPPAAGPQKMHATRGAVEGDPSFGPIHKNDAPDESILLFASNAYAPANDGKQGHGPLTQLFLRHALQRGLNVEDLLKQIVTGVREVTLLGYGKAQNPTSYQSFTGHHCFAGCFNPDNFTVPVTP